MLQMISGLHVGSDWQENRAAFHPCGSTSTLLSRLLIVASNRDKSSKKNHSCHQFPRSSPSLLNLLRASDGDTTSLQTDVRKSRASAVRGPREGGVIPPNSTT